MLAVDNTKSFWEAHKGVYAESVKAPMTALTEALAPEFGQAKVFRPYRDVRFAKDKTPYKTHQGAYVPAAPACGWYVQVGAPGVMVGGGFYDAGPAPLARLRASIDEEATGRELEALLAELTGQGFEVGGDRVKTAPRGFSVDHPRIELLRHRSLTLSRHYGFEPFVHTAALLDHVRADWQRLRPLVEWLAARLEG